MDPLFASFPPVPKRTEWAQVDSVPGGGSQAYGMNQKQLTEVAVASSRSPRETALKATATFTEQEVVFEPLLTIL